MIRSSKDSLGDPAAEYTARRDRLAELVEASGRIIAFTGAGISTECGIPDFRSPGGVWDRFRPIDFKTFLSSPEMRREGLSRFLSIRDEVGEVRPGRGHEAIAALHRRGKLACVITQNIDGLHQASGVPAARVIELHGNGTYAHCLRCGERHELDWVAAELERIAGAPECTVCGGIVKTATISFGQPMPADAMLAAEKALKACDLMLAIGSSLQVFPAAAMPVMAKRNGARLVIVNGEATDMDRHADLVIHADIGDTLNFLVGHGEGEAADSR